MSWAESPNAFGKLASFTDDPLSLESVAVRASLVGLPKEILLHITSFLPPGTKHHGHRGRFGFEAMSSDLRGLSSCCSMLYQFFRPLRFRSLSLGGDEKSLAYALLVQQDLDACRLVCELEITSLCPCHGELSEPFAELISKLHSLETFWFDGIHPLPPPVIGALSKLKEFKLEGVNVSRAALESIAQMAKTRSWRKGGALEGLKRISLRQDFPMDPSTGIMSPPWLLAHPEEKWEEIEHSLLHSVSTFLSNSASTLEELDLNIHPRFDSTSYGNDLPLRTMLSAPLTDSSDPPSSSASSSKSKNGKSKHNKSSSSSSNQTDLVPPSSSSSSPSPPSKKKSPKCDVSLYRLPSLTEGGVDDPHHSHQLSLPLLTKLSLPPTDLTSPTLRSFLLQAPLLEDLTVTHRPLLRIAVVSIVANSAVLHISYDATKRIQLEPGLRRLRRLVYQYEIGSKELEEQRRIQVEGEGEQRIESFHVQMLRSVRGWVGLVDLTLGGLYRVTNEELEVVAECCEVLEVLVVNAAFWEGDVSSIQQALRPLKQLVKLKIDLPPEQTEPPTMVPPVFALSELPGDERMSAGELMDEIDYYFYDGAEDTDEEDDEEEEEEDEDEENDYDDDEEEEDSSNASAESWRTGIESLSDRDDDWHSARGSIIDGEADHEPRLTLRDMLQTQLAELEASSTSSTFSVPPSPFFLPPTLPPSPPAIDTTPFPLLLTTAQHQPLPPSPPSSATSTTSSHSHSSSSSSSSSSSEPDQTIYAGHYQNENLFHFSSIAHGFASQHPRLEEFELVMDPYLAVVWRVERTTALEEGTGEGKGQEEEEEGEQVRVREELVYPGLMDLCMMEAGW